MLHVLLRRLAVGALAALWTTSARADVVPPAEPPFDLQFFGDVYIPEHVVRALGQEGEGASPFEPMRPILEAATHNVANLEGAATDAFVAHEPKRFLLRIPPSAIAFVRAAGIDVVTLANNHSMDFGWPGLFDTLVTLGEAGIVGVGAGSDADAAYAPVIVGTNAGRTVCLLSFSRTLPDSFWAGAERPGTAYADRARVVAAVSACAAAGHLPIAVFHWGREGEGRPQPYQTELARAAIDAGARMIIGHHPHVLQTIDVYKGRPIFYSLGNFAFGSKPERSIFEGLAVRVRLGATTADRDDVELLALDVDNDRVRYRPRPLSAPIKDPIAAHMAKGVGCKRAPDATNEQRRWSCSF
jgi:poly-gamma-glutamate synthesis protein (capsule biosynthesis protein)